MTFVELQHLSTKANLIVLHEKHEERLEEFHHIPEDEQENVWTKDGNTQIHFIKKIMRLMTNSRNAVIALNIVSKFTTLDCDRLDKIIADSIKDLDKAEYNYYNDQLKSVFTNKDALSIINKLSLMHPINIKDAKKALKNVIAGVVLVDY